MKQALTIWNINLAITLLFNNTPVDFLQINTLEYPVPSGLTWDTQLDLPGDTLARTALDPGGPLSAQWEYSYGTLGYPNSSTGQNDQPISIYYPKKPPPLGVVTVRLCLKAVWSRGDSKSYKPVGLFPVAPRSKPF